METKILAINRGRIDRKKIRLAAEAIMSGKLVVFPTETVYGVGANALDPKACKRIYKVKGRPAKNPLMIHVSDMRMASRIGIFPKEYYDVVKRLWPGPIAFVVDAREGLGRKEVSIRMPDDKIALALIKASKVPIAAPSANISKKPSSTSAKHALDYFKGKVEFIVDGGRSRKGIESTILDLRNFRLQRPGSLPVEELAKAFGRRPIVTDSSRGLKESGAAVAPGMRYRHYSPDTPLFIYEGTLKKLLMLTSGLGDNFAVIGSNELCRLMKGRSIYLVNLGSGLDNVARGLFDGLIRLDRLNVDFAISGSFPERGIGLAIMNRLRKASNHNYFSTRKELLGLMRKKRLL